MMKEDWRYLVCLTVLVAMIAMIVSAVVLLGAGVAP